MKLKYPALLALFCASTAQATSVFINEIHYDNIGGDVGEFIEIAAPQGTDLTGWSVVLYNGSSTQLTDYSTENLSGTVINQGGGYGFATVYPNSIQNGAPDGMALIDAGGNVVQFLSYEGSFEAASGPAIGLTSIDIGVAESTTTPVGVSLQLSGSGSEYADFSWQAEAAETPDSINNGQSFGGEVTDSAPSVVVSPADGESNVAIDANISLTFNEPVVIGAYNTIDCASDVAITVTASGDGTSYLLNPDQDFAPGDSCSFTVSAIDVTDLDGEPDNMAEDVIVSFTVIDSSATVSLVINEFHADPAADISGDANGDGTRDSSDDEFVELVNAGDSAIDVSGWTISDAVQVRHTFPSGSVIEAGCAAVIFGGGTPQGVFGGALVQAASSGTVGLNNGGDTITVSNGISTFEVVYGSEGANDQSLTLNPDVTGESYSAHATVSEANGALFSPGTKLDGTSFAGCTVPDLAPTVVNISPVDGATDVGVGSVINLTFSERVTVTQWPNLVCNISGEVALDGALSGIDFTLTPTTELSGNDMCTLTLPADSVVDEDGTPDMLAAEFVSSFSTAELLVCNAPDTFIHQVQGSGSASALVDQTVLVQAVVTAVLPDSNVFYVQEEDADTDGDPSTSEGVLVFNESGAFNMPAVGDVVSVKGTVSEFFDRTQITLSSAPLVCGTATVSATDFTLPVTSLDDFEALEGMLVTSSAALTVTDNFTLGRFGQLTLSNGRLYNPTNIFTPGSAEAVSLAASNSLNRLLLDDGNDTSNPDVVPFPTGGLSADNTLRMGDTVSALTGVVDYSFSEYRVIPTEAPTFAATNSRTSQPELTLGNLKVASLNVLNFFNTIDAGQDICGPTGGFECRGADDNGTDTNGLSEFDRQKVKTVAAIVAMNADIVGLMEIENDGFGPDSAIIELVEGINAQMGEDTYAVVDGGSTIGTDAITVALIYKPASVTLSGELAVLTSDNSITDDNGALFDDTKNRPSLAQKFALVENGETLVVSVNHLKSKGSGCGAGDDDTTTGQGNCNVTRTRAAQALTTFITEQFGDTPALIIGDLNSYAKEDPISAIMSAGYTDLANYFGGDQAYSYSFNGELGYLDHALASASMLDSVVDTTEWHINADEPIVLDYNLDFQSEVQQVKYFAPDAYRMSDHDPVVISLQLESDVQVVEGDFDADGDVDIMDIRALTRAIQLRQTIDNSFDFDEDGQVTYTDVRLLQRMCTRTSCAI
ncbi:ExeM/NucH family extracellular endonuclease [uncultured Paraglaciecola sp.]|uniref:ExeM/NucH family extracellular endonuclease n=1 Tax=uncultured Paraglaciecola sp. TaxID=1765024 RepID=UPI0030DBDC15|tara:strand:+ start:4022 stop:7696 length:3675 start_codon:yes stop_codon:yes gene_type:complete